MSLIYDGTTIDKVIYDGVEMTKVIYDGVTVFEKSVTPTYDNDYWFTYSNTNFSVNSNISKGNNNMLDGDAQAGWSWNNNQNNYCYFNVVEPTAVGTVNITFPKLNIPASSNITQVAVHMTYSTWYNDFTTGPLFTMKNPSNSNVSISGENFKTPGQSNKQMYLYPTGSGTYNQYVFVADATALAAFKAGFSSGQKVRLTLNTKSPVGFRFDTKFYKLSLNIQFNT